VEQAGTDLADRGVPGDLTVVRDQRSAIGDPTATAHRIPDRGVVADHALVQCDRAAWAAAHAVAARDPAAAGCGVVIDGAVTQGQRRGQADDATAARPIRRHGVPAHFAVV